MITIEALIGFYTINFISTYAIRCHVINKNVDDFCDMAKEKGIPDDFKDYMVRKLDKKPTWYDYVPVVNIILALKDWVNRKKDMELLEDDMKHFENQYGPIEQFVTNHQNDQDKVEVQYKEYYVGYFLGSKPVVIYFKYDGDTNIVVSEDSASTFKNLDDQTQADTLMSILYSIYLGSREFIRCMSISEVFTETMVETLVNTFENNNLGFVIEREQEKDLTRRKPQ